MAHEFEVAVWSDGDGVGQGLLPVRKPSAWPSWLPAAPWETSLRPFSQLLVYHFQVAQLVMHVCPLRPWRRLLLSMRQMHPVHLLQCS